MGLFTTLLRESNTAVVPAHVGFHSVAPGHVSLAGIATVVVVSQSAVWVAVRGPGVLVRRLASPHLAG